MTRKQPQSWPSALVRLSLVALVTVPLAQRAASAKVKPHQLFTDGAVVQQGMPLKVWGTAGDGEEITVSFADQEASTTAEDGKWQVELAPLSAGGPYQMVIEGEDRVEINDIHVGEVWICSGQSNMVWPLTRTHEAEAAIAAANHPKIRLFTVPRRATGDPQDDVDTRWQVCSPETAANFSAVAYYFGRDLQQELDVAIGLISTNYGGTPAEAWTSREKLDSKPELRGLLNSDRQPTNSHYPGGLYNAMIHPLLDYPIRGAIWYQGESNASRAWQYRTLFPTMITDWRERWGQGDFPFLLVQLAPFQDRTEVSDWAELREAQLLSTQVLRNVAMAVITDVGEKTDIHPQKKEPVGQRLALAARALAYGQDIEYSGPVLSDFSVKGNKALLVFDHAEEGLVAKDGALQGFTIAGADQEFHPAEAKIISEDTIEVTSSEVSDPIAVRYGWADFPVVNLWNGAGLPATPFRTDDFAVSTMVNQ